MTILRSGASKEYSEGWEAAFGKKAKKTVALDRKSRSAKSPSKRSTPKKAVKKKATKTTVKKRAAGQRKKK